jgi:hypothetical protein
MVTGARGWPGPRFRVHVTFRAPLDFAYAWCTDYRTDDARRERVPYRRRVLEKGPHRVVFEDLSEASSGGWSWTRYVVTLRPPGRWHADAVGSHRDLAIDYRLTALGPSRTALDLTWRRRPTAIGEGRLVRRQVERESLEGWRNFARALEADYRRAKRRRRRPTGR